MTNLTSSEARRLIDKLHHNQTKEHGISILEEKYLAALEIALPVLEQQGGWISCSERLPKDDGQYWGWWSEENRQGPVWFIERQSQFQSYQITHWMPMPVPPQPQTDTYRQIENDGWIELGEGAIPEHPETVVEIKMRNGVIDVPRKAGGFFWYRGNDIRDEMDCDIIAYRVIENDGREG